MSLSILPFVLGPLENNSYLIINESSSEAAIVDPSFEPNPIFDEIMKRQLDVKMILLTHAHFDHLAGIPYLYSRLAQPLDIYLHPADLYLYENQGDAAHFGIQLGEFPESITAMSDKVKIPLGEEKIEVRHVPGHTPGHVLFYLPSIQSALCGDLLFYHSIGRTDLAGGDMNDLLKSVRTQVFTLPPETILYPGHGPATSVREESQNNPFLA